MTYAKKTAQNPRPQKPKWHMRRNYPLHLMLLVPILFLIVFSYLPMGGIVIGFQDFKPWLGITGSKWIGLKHFETLLRYPDSQKVIANTLIISASKLVTKAITPFLFAIFLNEVRNKQYKKWYRPWLIYRISFPGWYSAASLRMCFP